MDHHTAHTGGASTAGAVTGGGAGRVVPVVTVGLAVLMQLTLLMPTVASGLVAPAWAIVGLHALWGATVIALVAVGRRRPLVAPVVPVANAVALCLLITLGQGWLGWTG